MKKIILSIAALIAVSNVFAYEKLFNEARFSQSTFEGKTSSFIGEDCSISFDRQGDIVSVNVRKDSFEKTYTYGVNASLFFRGDYGLEFSDGQYATESNPALLIKFDLKAWDEAQELVPMEYKIVTKRANSHVLIGGGETRLYRCTF